MSNGNKVTTHSAQAKLIFPVQRSRQLLKLVSPHANGRTSAEAPIVLAAIEEKFAKILIQGASGCATFHGRSRIQPGDVFAIICNDQELSRLVRGFVDFHIGNYPGVTSLLDPSNRQRYTAHMKRIQTRVKDKIRKEKKQRRLGSPKNAESKLGGPNKKRAIVVSKSREGMRQNKHTKGAGEVGPKSLPSPQRRKRKPTHKLSSGAKRENKTKSPHKLLHQ